MEALHNDTRTQGLDGQLLEPRPVKGRRTHIGAACSACTAAMLLAALTACGGSYRDDFYAIRGFVITPEAGSGMEIVVRDVPEWNDPFEPAQPEAFAAAGSGRR